MAKPSARPKRSTRSGQQLRSTILFHAQSGPIECGHCGRKPLPPLQHWPTPPPRTRSSEAPQSRTLRVHDCCVPDQERGQNGGLVR